MSATENKNDAITEIYFVGVFESQNELLFVCLKNDTKCPQVKKMLVKSIGD